MPVVFTFDLDGAPPQERNRLQSMFERLGWQNIGGSAYRYPRLGSKRRVEDWFNHVLPALMLFRSYVRSSGRDLTKFTLDVQTSSGFDAGNEKYGNPPLPAAGKEAIDFFEPTNAAFGAKNLKKWIDGIEFPYDVGDGEV